MKEWNVRRLLVIGVVALAVATVVGAGSCTPVTECNHRLWVKGTVIKTHSWPFPDVTAAEVRNQADWKSIGYSPSCYGIGVNSMRGTGNPEFWNYCYWNPLQDGTTGVWCEEVTYGKADSWNHHNMDGRFNRSGGAYTLKTTVYAATDRNYSGSCSIRNGTISSSSRFQCPYDFVF